VVELVDLPDRPGSADAVATLIRQRGLKVETEGFLLTIESDNDAALDAVRDAVADAGARLRRLGGRHRRLEDVFTDTEPDAGAGPGTEPDPTPG
jgi:hypothetical protein